VNAEFVYYILSLTFGAGVTYGVFRQMRKDVSGIGSKVAREKRSSETRHQNIALALMLMCPAEQREQIAALLKSAENGETNQ
jgi:hypothetical protein